jgi:hypothetical protein
MNVGEFCVLARSLQLPTNHVLKTVVRDDMVVSSLILDGYGLLHQATLLEFVAVDKRATEAALLIRCEALSKVRVHLACRIVFARVRSVERRVLKLVIGVVDVFTGLADGRPRAFLSLALSSTRWVERSLLFLWFQRSYELSINQAVVHHPARRPMHSVGPALDS